MLDHVKFRRHRNTGSDVLRRSKITRDGRTYGPTDGRTDTTSYKDGLLKESVHRLGDADEDGNSDTVGLVSAGAGVKRVSLSTTVMPQSRTVFC